jgi:hypothetical protein
MYDKEKEHDSWIEEQEGHDMEDSPSQNENDCMSDVSSSDDEVDIQINVHDDWADVWEKLKRMGWCWKAGRGLVDFYYIFPKGKVKGGKEGIDYFTSETELQEYVRRTHGWRNRSQEIHKEEIVSFIPREEMSTIKRSKSDIDSSPYSVKKRKIIVDIEDSDSHFSGIDENDSLSSDDNIQPNEPWADVWQKLKRQGWSWKAGGGLVAYYYVFPGGKVKGGKEGIDFFIDEEDLKDYIRRTHGWNGGGNDGQTPHQRARYSLRRPDYYYA